MVRLLQDEEFANALNKRYFELRNSYLSFSHLQSYIDSVKNLVNEAQARHYTKWNILSASVGAPEVDSQPGTYAGQVTQFSNWIKTRLTWLDANMPGKSIPTTVDLQPQAFSYRIFPNPTSELVYIEASSEINGIEVFSSGGKLVLSQSGISACETRVDVSNFAPGVYLINMKLAGKQPIRSKLVVR
jgi:hypothetical protein